MEKEVTTAASMLNNKRREMCKTSVADVYRERGRFGHLDVDGKVNVKVVLKTIGEDGVEFSNPSLGG